MGGHPKQTEPCSLWTDGEGWTIVNVIGLIGITFAYCSQTMLGMGLAGRGRRAALQKCSAVKILQKVKGDSSTSWATAAACTACCWPRVRRGQTPHSCIASPPCSPWKCLWGADRLKCSWSLGKHALLLSSLQYSKLETGLLVTIPFKLNKSGLSFFFCVCAQY